MKLMINNAGFTGMVLSNEQRKSIQLYMKSVLGEENYAYTEGFFSFIKDSKAKYKVIMARKCFNLLNAYYRSKYSKALAGIEDTMISDSALFAYIPEIVHEYKIRGIFPEILIADDILIHGRAIRWLLDTFIHKIYEFLQNTGRNIDYQEIESEALRSISVITIVQSDRALLMKPVYFQRMLDSGYPFHAWKSYRWRDFSFKIAYANGEGSFSNTSYTLTMYEKQSGELIHEYAAETAAKNGFSRSSWNNRNVRDVWVKPLKNANGDYQAFYTLRITQDSTLDRYSIIPFIILPDIKISFCRELFYKIFSADIMVGLETTSFADRSCAELLYLTLNYDLMLLLNQYDPRIAVTNDVLDIDKIMMNFGVRSIYGRAFAELMEHTAPFLSWEQLDAFIYNGSEGFEPVMKEKAKPSTLFKYTSLSEAFEEAIANEGEELELKANNDFLNQNLSVEVKPRKDVRNLFSRIEQSPVMKYNDREIVELVANMLRQMDMGEISLGADSRNGDSFYCAYRTGEQSQFIHPKKYSDHLPVLVQMEKDCNSNPNEIIKRIADFYGQNPDLQNKLSDYVRYLYSSGQRLHDWDINWINSTEVDDKIRRECPGLSQSNLLFAQMIKRSVAQRKELNEYHNMYPQQK